MRATLVRYGGASRPPATSDPQLNYLRTIMRENVLWASLWCTTLYGVVCVCGWVGGVRKHACRWHTSTINLGHLFLPSTLLETGLYAPISCRTLRCLTRELPGLLLFELPISLLEWWSYGYAQPPQSQVGSWDRSLGPRVSATLVHTTHWTCSPAPMPHLLMKGNKSFFPIQWTIRTCLQSYLLS